MVNKMCPICSGALSSGLESWHAVCQRCGYEKADLLPAINSEAAHRMIDESDRAVALRELRNGNFQILIAAIKHLLPEGGRLLEVGSAHGWFLEAAQKDFDVLGIEPDKQVISEAGQLGLPVREGFFPDILGAEEKFDIIVFNDVFEHLPNIETALDSCRQHLEQGGLLVLNLPNSKGVFYHLSKLAHRAGYKPFFERMWQKGLPSPHLHYFNFYNLLVLLEKHDFHIQTRGTLSTLDLKGLYTRISYAGNFGPITRGLVYCVAILAIPLLKLLPGDIIYLIAARTR